MRSMIATTFPLTVSLFAGSAFACEPVMDDRTLSEIRLQSRPTAADPQCRTINIGVHDRLALGPAVDLGNGRIQQVFVFMGDEDKSRVLLTDCNAREATILQGVVTETSESSCGIYETHADLVGEKAMMPLDGEANLHDLVELAKSKGVTEISPSEFFFQFSKDWENELHPVGRKDRFDLLCGCKRYYPDSAGASD